MKATSIMTYDNVVDNEVPSTAPSVCPATESSSRAAITTVVLSVQCNSKNNPSGLKRRLDVSTTPA